MAVTVFTGLSGWRLTSNLVIAGLAGWLKGQRHWVPTVMIWVPSLTTTWWKERTSSPSCPLACMCILGKCTHKHIHTHIIVINKQPQLSQVTVTSDCLTCSPTVSSVYASLSYHQVSKTPHVSWPMQSMLCILGRSAMFSGVLCCTERAAVEDPGFCHNEDVMYTKNNSFWKVWKRRGYRPKEKKNALAQTAEEGGPESGGEERKVRG